MTTKTEYIHRITSTATSVSHISTDTYFDVSHSETSKSPIDSCFEKMTDLNLIHIKFGNISDITSKLIRTQNNLILLGYISAVESYLREIIRKLITVDKASRISSHGQQLSYGAALSYPINVLPEALLERSSYASKNNIKDSFKTHLGLKGNTPKELEDSLDEFEKVCHLRHCVVHRFGKLGSNNAIKFGLDKHRECLEKPLDINMIKLYEIYQICENTVLVINQYLFTKILMRSVEAEYSEWKWDLRKDRKLFSMYYNLFYSNLKPDSNTTLSKAYNALKLYKTSI